MSADTKPMRMANLRIAGKESAGCGRVKGVVPKSEPDAHVCDATAAQKPADAGSTKTVFNISDMLPEGVILMQ